jgi:carbonic anhydrase
LLTTPLCTEGVTWLVNSRPLPLDVSAFMAAKKVLRFNARYTQNAPGQPNLVKVVAENLHNLPPKMKNGRYLVFQARL